MFVRVDGKKEAPRWTEPITVHLVGCEEKKVQVYQNDPINKIYDLINNKKSLVIFNGGVLNSSLSFAFYGIGDGDSLAIIDQQTKSLGTNDDPDIFFTMKYFDMLRQMRNMNQQYSNDEINGQFEASRLLDLSFNKLMYRPSSFRRVCKMISKRINQNDNISENSTVLPEKAENPSTELLPLSQANADSQSN